MGNWEIVRLICFREIRDQFRDRRTLVMVVILPVVLYPLLGFAVFQYALTQGDKASVVGIHGLEHLPKPSPLAADTSPAPIVAWLTAVPTPGTGWEQVCSAAALAAQAQRLAEYPPLVVTGKDGWKVSDVYFDTPQQGRALRVRRLIEDDGKSRLEGKEIDVLVTVPPDFMTKLAAGERPSVLIETREADETSELANRRVRRALNRWKAALKDTRLARHGMPPGFDETLEIATPERARPALEQEARDLEKAFIRIFPFMVVMWAMAGAMYPAIDICAGEKERGTLETLLISPAGRDEIAWGKFLTIWAFSCSTTTWNLLGMSCTTWMVTRALPHLVPSPIALAWCLISVIPLAALFSAICLAVGVFARSTKEGQYYLMPLFLLTLPLILISLTPDVTLTPLTALVPVTGMALLMQKVMLATTPDQVPWLYFAPVLGMLALYCWLALVGATRLFQREEVLFREAEHFWDFRFWRRRVGERRN